MSLAGKSIELTGGPLWSLGLNLSRFYQGLDTLKSALMTLVLVSVTSLGPVILGKMHVPLELAICPLRRLIFVLVAGNVCMSVVYVYRASFL